MSSESASSKTDQIENVNNCMLNDYNKDSVSLQFQQCKHHSGERNTHKKNENAKRYLYIFFCLKQILKVFKLFSFVFYYQSNSDDFSLEKANTSSYSDFVYWQAPAGLLELPEQVKQVTQESDHSKLVNQYYAKRTRLCSLPTEHGEEKCSATSALNLDVQVTSQSATSTNSPVVALASNETKQQSFAHPNPNPTTNTPIAANSPINFSNLITTTRFLHHSPLATANNTTPTTNTTKEVECGGVEPVSPNSVSKRHSLLIEANKTPVLSSSRNLFHSDTQKVTPNNNIEIE